MPAVKLGRDIRANATRLALMVVAIAISLTVFGAVLMAWATVGRETAAAYVGTKPASATLVLGKPVDAATMAELAAAARGRPGVVEATGRTQLTGEVAVNGVARKIPLQVFAAAPDDPMRVATFRMRQRAWPPAPDEIYLGQDTLALLDVAVGDTVTVTTAGGRVNLRVADTVYDPSLSPSPQEQTGRGYVSTAALPGTLTGAVDQLKIRAEASDLDRDAIVAVAGELARWLQRERGVAVREIQVPEPDAHPHQWQADALLASLLAGGAAVLLLSTILVAGMLAGLFTQQIPQVGIMKAIGARAGHIGRLYLTLTLLVAAAAGLLAIGPAVLLGRAGVDLFLGFLGIEPVSLAAPGWTYPVLVLTGLALPPLMALSPLVRASRMTVRAAIDHHGRGTRPIAAGGLLARLGRVRGVNRMLLMAMRNTLRRPARFALAVGLLASAGAVFVAGMSLSDGVAAIDEQRREQRNWDVEVQLTEPVAADRVGAVVGAVPGVSRVEGWHRAKAGLAGPGQIPLTRTYPDQGHGAIAVTAVPGGTTMLPPPKLLEGRWLEPGERGALVLNQISRDTSMPGLRAGATVQLFLGATATTWRVVGIVEERGGHGGIYTTAEGLAAATDGASPRANLLRVATDRHDEPARTAVAQAVEKALTGAGIGVQSATSVSRSDAISEGHLSPLIMIVLAIAVTMGVVGGIGLASTMSTNVLERTREFGIMHAVGARPRTVRRIVTVEGIVTAVASLLVAVVPTIVLTALLGAGLGNLFMSAALPFRISIAAVALWSVLAVLGAALASEAAATGASRITVREALTHV